jgi:hypothetical protein
MIRCIFTDQSWDAAEERATCASCRPAAPWSTRRRGRIDLPVRHAHMPAFGRHRPEFDDRPARGPFEDIFDDSLDDEFSGAELPLRAKERYSAEPDVWLAQTRMSQTEVSLRLGRFLLRSPMVASNVVVTLAGYELTRQEQPQFPVMRYLTERLGFAPKVNRPYKWRGHYALPGIERRLVLHLDPSFGHVCVRLATGNRLIVFVSGGTMGSKRGSSEHRTIHSTIGRAVVWGGARATDEIGICVPRSGRFRRAISEYRKADRVQRLGIHLLTVDRVTGDVSGLGDLECRCSAKDTRS